MDKWVSIDMLQYSNFKAGLVDDLLTDCRLDTNKQA